MTCCLIVGQIANLMRIYTEFHNHINFLIMGMSLLCKCCNHILIVFSSLYALQIWFQRFRLLQHYFGLADWAISFGKRFGRVMCSCALPMAKSIAGIRFTYGAVRFVWQAWEYSPITIWISAYQRKVCRKNSLKLNR